MYAQDLACIMHGLNQLYQDKFGFAFLRMNCAAKYN